MRKKERLMTALATPLLREEAREIMAASVQTLTPLVIFPTLVTYSTSFSGEALNIVENADLAQRKDKI